MDSLQNSPWYGWIFLSVMGLVNLILGFIIVPMKGEITEIKDKAALCKQENGSLLYHLDKETKRQDAALRQVALDITEIKDRSIRTEENIKEVKATNSRIEKKLDALNGRA